MLQVDWFSWVTAHGQILPLCVIFINIGLFIIVSNVNLEFLFTLSVPVVTSDVDVLLIYSMFRIYWFI
ncbi:hypothetical protein XELAEV_18045296mg [Xenopus laevis]|uniref:Transmembrane protein n=1 Tax=Xenopus laevis TaxID=8355 RepID=A0A974C0D5_XENLA|nr:hypothetical protein XELAEV_18045296mg [Xenopus laevis]